MTDRDLTPEEIEALKSVKVAYDETELAFAQAVGLFTMRFGKLEADTNIAIGDFLGLKTMNLTTMLTSAIQSVRTRLNILSSLVHGSRMSDELRAKLIKCVKEIEELRISRNWLLHEPFHPGLLSQGGDETTEHREWIKLRARVDEKLRRQERSFSVHQILSESERCGPLGTTIITLTKQYCGEREKLEPSQ